MLGGGGCNSSVQEQPVAFMRHRERGQGEILNLFKPEFLPPDFHNKQVCDGATVICIFYKGDSGVMQTLININEYLGYLWMISILGALCR